MKKQKISIPKRRLTRAVIMPILFFGLFCLVAGKAHAQDVTYKFTDESPVSSIKFAANTSKCAAIKDANASGASNVELALCKDALTQKWVIDDARIRLAANTSKCMELYKNYTDNGANVQIYNCTAGSGQRWIYDVLRKIIRSGNDFNKCLDLVNGNTASGTNIQLYDCTSNFNQPSQQWIIDGIPSRMPTGSNVKIHLAGDPDKCVDLDSYNFSNGANVRLYRCRNTKAQHFVFDGRYIRSQDAATKCLSLQDSGDANGNNVYLWDCKGQDRQKWVYDGFAKAFRSVVNFNKCLSIKDNDVHDGANILLWDCKNNGSQRFDLY